MADLLQVLAKESAMWQKTSDSQSLFDFARDYKCLLEFLNVVAKIGCGAERTIAEIKSDDEEKPVFVGTVHSAKSLEFDTVFIVNCNNFPLSYASFDEDCRLFFVAVTRAKGMSHIVAP